MQDVSVALADRSYRIHIGSNLLAESRLYAPHVAGKRAAVVTNGVVAPLYLQTVQAAPSAPGAPG